MFCFQQFQQIKKKIAACFLKKILYFLSFINFFLFSFHIFFILFSPHFTSFILYHSTSRNLFKQTGDVYLCEFESFFSFVHSNILIYIFFLKLYNLVPDIASNKFSSFFPKEKFPLLKSWKQIKKKWK